MAGLQGGMYYDQRPRYDQGAGLCDPGDCGMSNLGLIITGLLLSLLGLTSLGLGIGLATYYGTDFHWYPYIPIWGGVLYLLAGFLGTSVCCCFGNNDAIRCMMWSFMAVCIIAVVVAIAQVLDEMLLATALGVTDAIIGGEYSVLDTLRALHISAAVVGGIAGLVALVGSILVCANACWGPTQPLATNTIINFGGPPQGMAPPVYQQPGIPMYNQQMHHQQGIYM